MSPSRRPSRSELTAPPLVALVLALVAYVIAPVSFESAHRLTMTAIVALASLPLIAANPKRLERSAPWSRTLAATLALLLISANVGAAVDVILGFGDLDETALARLLVAAVQVGVTHIVAFGLLFWLFDRGGPVERRHRPPNSLPPADFEFSGPGHYIDTDWMPPYADYLVLSLRNALALTTSGPHPASPRARFLTGLQTFTSFAFLGIIVVRTVVALVS